jgi:hypothetical protein
MIIWIIFMKVNYYCKKNNLYIIRSGGTETDAHAELSRADSARAGYYAKISGEKWGAAKRYDLCLDSSIGAQKAANVIVEYVRDFA